MSITSTAFVNKGQIPSKYTCDGENVNPPLSIANVPFDSQSLVLIVEDPDAPGKRWVHWIVINIDPKAVAVRENSIPMGGKEAYSDFGYVGYGGPCPPNGPHRYNFKLYALDEVLNVTEDVTLDELEQMMSKRTIEKAELTGIYSRD